LIPVLCPSVYVVFLIHDTVFVREGYSITDHHAFDNTRNIQASESTNDFAGLFESEP